MERKDSSRRDAPLFSYFLKPTRFSILLFGGVLSFIGWIYFCWAIGDRTMVSTQVLSLFILVPLACYVYHLTKRILNGFNTIFYWNPTQGKELVGAGRVRYLFSQSETFERYRRSVFRMIYNKREKYFVIGLAFLVILPLVIMQEYQRGTLDYASLRSWSFWQIGSYSYFHIYWTVIYSILLSIVWMIITVARALLNLKKEEKHLHITQSIREFQESFLSSREKEIPNAKIALLDLSFRRFKAGLSPIVNFVFSSSLRIAFVGTMCSIPALMYFLITREMVIEWYAMCASTGLLSIGLFVVGQYGAWRVWAKSKEDAGLLLDNICAIKTQNYSKQIASLPHSEQVSSVQAKDVEKDVSFLREVIVDLDELSATTYTSSSVFRLTAVNFLSFGPIILECLLFLFLPL